MAEKEAEEKEEEEKEMKQVKTMRRGGGKGVGGEKEEDYDVKGSEVTGGEKGKEGGRGDGSWKPQGGGEGGAGGGRGEQVSQRQRQQQRDGAVCSDGPVLDDLLELRVQHAGTGDHHLRG